MLAVLACARAAWADDFAVGDRVHIGNAGKEGTVLAVGQRLTDGGTYLKVHVDGAAYPAEVGLMYDSMVAQVTVVGHGGARDAAAVVPASPVAVGAAADSRPPGHVAPSAEACKQAIRANYPAAGDDQAITVTFLAFEISDGGAYTATYAGDLQAPYGRGHVVQAMSVHARYRVLTHYADPNADDLSRTYDAKFKCYDTAATGELIAEMTERLPGGEHATYIPKR